VTKVQSSTPYGPRWSSNDRRIGFFNQPAGASFSASLMVTDASGGAPRVISREFDFRGFTWAPDDAGLIVSSAKGSSMAYPPAFSLWFTTISGTPRQLTFGETSYEFPDTNLSGAVVASRVRGNSDVWRFPATGKPRQNAERALRITHQTGTVQTVTVSPDESEVAFLSDNGGHANVWAARVADGETRAITHEFDPQVVIAVPHWSPRGDFINFLSNRTSLGPEVTLWIVRPDGSELHDLRIVGSGVCWSSDGRWLYYHDQKSFSSMYKVGVGGGNPVLIRSDNARACSAAPDGTMYYSRILTQAAGSWDYEIRAAVPENGPSRLLGWVSGSRVPAHPTDFQVFVSPDGKWLAMPLVDGQTTNLWALSTKGDGWRKLVDFGPRNVIIARRIAWSRDGKSIYASMSDVDSDIVMLSGLKWR
jgi:Tol biopolymer transport system component